MNTIEPKLLPFWLSSNKGPRYTEANAPAWGC